MKFLILYHPLKDGDDTKYTTIFADSINEVTKLAKKFYKKTHRVHSITQGDV